MNLITVDGWINPNGKRIGRYVNEEGLALCGFYRRDYKNHSCMLVINNGHKLVQYKYPKVNIPFSSQMVRWQNLYFCGGYDVRKDNGLSTGSNELLFDTVAIAMKPIGFIITEDDIIKKMAASVKSKELEYAINPHFYQGYSELAIANKGKIKDHFDIESLIESYRIMGDALGYQLLTLYDESQLRKVSELLLSDFLKDYDYMNPSNDFEFVLTGLLLGYPIESTVACLTYQVS